MASGDSKSSATPVRSGRLRLVSGRGSEWAPYVVRSEAQYWTGSYGQTNLADSCTTYATANIALSGTTGTTVSAVGALANGFGSITLGQPSAAGKATVCLDMASSSDGCTAGTPVSIDYLRGNWTDSTYTADPSATVLFGRAAQNTRGKWGFLYRRKNFQAALVKPRPRTPGNATRISFSVVRAVCLPVGSGWHCRSSRRR
ncbi:DUF6701 domain-containing protein [Propionivibrio dicarboxylicus]|uniref:DUF6701 domain-containing protein n=1 Tax=Propionivibrio dicarboxylicus TaxID=83767 RepID=UPI00115FCC18|nr:DUF6701 domain-containing protein [Propionivibrio dicarboxylicus]